MSTRTLQVEVNQLKDVVMKQNKKIQELEDKLQMLLGFAEKNLKDSISGKKK